MLPFRPAKILFGPRRSMTGHQLHFFTEYTIPTTAIATMMIAKIQTGGGMEGHPILFGASASDLSLSSSTWICILISRDLQDTM